MPRLSRWGRAAALTLTVLAALAAWLSSRPRDVTSLLIVSDAPIKGAELVLEGRVYPMHRSEYGERYVIGWGGLPISGESADIAVSWVGPDGLRRGVRGSRPVYEFNSTCLFYVRIDARGEAVATSGRTPEDEVLVYCHP